VVTVFDRMPAPNTAIERYGALLVRQLNEAVVVPYRQVNVGDWVPEENKCHHNVAAWIERNPRHEHVLGWLVIAAPNSDFIRFVAHSVVEDETGNRFDITPLHATEPRQCPMWNLCHEGFGTHCLKSCSSIGVNMRLRGPWLAGSNGRQWLIVQSSISLSQIYEYPTTSLFR
jgi:hypothetical protein